MSRPLVGVTLSGLSALPEAEVGTGPVANRYLDALVGAGAEPVVLRTDSDPQAALAPLAALVLSGGPDVDPARYGAERHPATRPARDGRDGFELAIVREADRRDVPLLAICRGLQVLNIARGGTLFQHLPDLVGHDRHAPGQGVYGATEVAITSGSALARALGRTSALVDCSHHQAVRALGSGLVPVAHAVDGVLEGAEDPARSFCLGVQWHPEEGDDPSLFVALVAAAGAPASPGARREQSATRGTPRR